jgi:hypothetical protein
MNEGISKEKLWLFYIGTFLSQLGTFTLILGLIYFPPLNGWSSLETGLLLSASHLFSTFALLKWGDIGDRVSPKKLILIVEFSAVIISIFTIYCWISDSIFARYLFILAIGLKSMITAIQSPARNKYLKLASNSKERSKNLSIFLTTINQGTIFFSALLSWFYFKEKSFVATIGFDLLSFLVNGLIILTLPEISIEKSSKQPFKNRILDYLAVNKFLSFKDIMASICIAGASLLIIRISSIKPDLAVILGGIFGLSFIISGYILSKIKREHIDHYIWPLYSISFFLLYFARSELTILIFMSILFILYALLMHIYLVNWQHESPVQKIANIFSVRTIILSLTLGLGEILFGKISPLITVYNEALIRGSISFVIAVFIFQKHRNHEFK